MKRTTYAIVAGSLAFGLTAAAASGVAFVIGTIDSTPGTTYYSKAIETTPCDGTYDVTWTINEYGYVTGYTATRTPPVGATAESDPGLEYCANVPARIVVTSSGMDVATDDQTTGADGSFSSTSWYLPEGGFIAKEGDMVTIIVGPNANTFLFNP